MFDRGRTKLHYHCQTHLVHSLQGNIGSFCLLMLLLFLEFILVSLKLKKKNNNNKLIALVYVVVLGRWLK